MKINVIKKAFLYATAAGFLLTACVSVEPIDFEAVNTDVESNKTDEYYAALREWKNTPGLPQTFVWADAWDGKLPTGANSMRGLPDSVTIIARWGQPMWGDAFSPEQRIDMEFVQKVKGTKVVRTILAGKIGDGIPGWDYDAYEIGNTSDEAIVRPVVAKYAEMIYDKVVETGYDGFDWDYEPTVGGGTGNYLWKNKVQRTIFVEELTYWFGKGATEAGRDRGGRKPAIPGLLFLIDGEVGGSWAVNMDREWLTYYVDYFVHQAYNSTTISNLNSRVTGTLNALSHWVDQGLITNEEIVRRIILTENFESYAKTGGGVLVQSSFVFKPTSGNYEGMDAQIGGFGIFRSPFDYNNGTYAGVPEYFFLRQGITNIYRIYRERQATP